MQILLWIRVPLKPFYLWMCYVYANERRRYMRNAFSHWRRPYSTTHRKQAHVYQPPVLWRLWRTSVQVVVRHLAAPLVCSAWISGSVENGTTSPPDCIHRPHLPRVTDNLVVNPLLHCVWYRGRLPSVNLTLVSRPCLVHNSWYYWGTQIGRQIGARRAGEYVIMEWKYMCFIVRLHQKYSTGVFYLWVTMMFIIQSVI